MKKSLLFGLALGLASPAIAADSWTSIGEGTFIESFYDYVDYYFEEYLDPDLQAPPVGEVLKVEFEKNNDVEGVYRMVNPYRNWSGNNSLDFSYDKLHNFYILIHAEDPEYVYLEDAETGVLAAGEMTKLHSNINTFVNMYGMELTKEFYGGGFGKLVDGVLTFPVDVAYSSDMLMLVHAINIYGTACPANGTGHLEIIFPEGFSDNNGVELVADEEAPVEYYDLNGVRVFNPEHGIFIKRQGTKAVKVAL